MEAAMKTGLAVFLMCITVLGSSLHCDRGLGVKRDAIDCTWGWNHLDADLVFNDDYVVAHYRTLVVPKGSTTFWHSMGKAKFFVNWQARLYVYKIGDMDVKTIIDGDGYFLVGWPHPYDPVKKGPLGRDEYSVTWTGRSVLIVRKNIDEATGKTRYDHDLVFEDEERVAELFTFADRITEITVADFDGAKYPDAHIMIYDKRTGSLTEGSSKRKHVITRADCGR